ncbi:MAG: hypothetical protein R3F59_04590 [Myxococcota bacterium]
MRLLPLLALGCAAGPVGPPGAGSGTVAGAYDGRPFDTVGAAWRIGHPDDPEQTLVVYVFDQPVDCADLASPGWDTRIDGAQSVEIKVVGLSPGTYPVTASRTAAPGESDVNYTLTATSGTPVEVSADTGTVVLDAVTDGAAGTFDLAFATGDTLAGTFDATACPDGSEP